MKTQITLFVLLLFLSACKTTSNSGKVVTTRIAFGSCADQDKPQPLLRVASLLSPDAFIYLGDNIYGDSEVMDTLRAKYDRLAAKPEFQLLKQSTKLYAVWDDHDYGKNDAGRHYPFKEASKEIFMDFWEVPADSERREHPGIYGVEYIKKPGQLIQIILLDTRTFRDDLIPNKFEEKGHKNDYAPNPSPDSTFLGEAQWKWLEQQLSEKADIRIIASSNQFSHSYNGWESWTNVPHERKRMLNLIKKTKANGVLFISGDVHWGEISKLKTKDLYPIYDVTSSGITQDWYNIEHNKNRVGKAIKQNNIGLIIINTKRGKTKIDLQLYDNTRSTVVKNKIELKDITFDK